MGWEMIKDGESCENYSPKNTYKKEFIDEYNGEIDVIGEDLLIIRNIHNKKKYYFDWESEDEKEKTVDELVDLLNEQENKIYCLGGDKCFLEKENKNLLKALDNVANYMQKQFKDVPLPDFMDWWNDIVMEGIE